MITTLNLQIFSTIQRHSPQAAVMVNHASGKHQVDTTGQMPSTDASVGSCEVSAAEPGQISDRQMSRTARNGILFLFIAALSLGVLQMKYNLLNLLAVRFLGPPQVELSEAYADTESTIQFDHSLLDVLLHQNVDVDGWVDYAGVRYSVDDLDAYLESVAQADVNALGRDDRLAFLINAYNAFTLKLIVEKYPLDSIKDIPANQRWDAVRWNLAGQTVSLSQIEHELIRPNFMEPRIHFALVCAATGCPPLLNEVYTGDRLEEQLSRQTAYVHQHGTWFQFDGANAETKLTQLYNWYGGDFEQTAGSVPAFVSQHAPDLKQAMATNGSPAITWLPYDWKLNDVANRQPR